MPSNMIRKTFTFDGKRYTVRGKTEKECYEKMALKKRDLEQGRYILTSNTSVKEWAEKALDVYKPNASEDYLKDIKYRFKKYIEPVIGNLPIKSVKPLQCQEILNTQVDKSKSQIAKLHNELVFIFETAKDNHLIYENPAEKLVRPDGYSNTRRSITKHERKHLLKVCATDPCYNLFLLMLYAGCRTEEAMNVQGMDLIKKENFYLLHIRGTKTENSDRYVPVVPELLPILQAVKPFDYVATNHAGRHHSESSYRKLVKHLKRDMNISMGCRLYRNALVPPLPLAEDFIPYLLRHTFCTDLQKKGVDLRAAQKLMGHADIQTTANIYTHQDEDTILQAAEQMGAKVSRQMSQVSH